MSDVVPFWPETEAQLKMIEDVANAALREVGLGHYRVWAEMDGAVHCDPYFGPDDEVEQVDRAITLGWKAARSMAEAGR